MAIIKLDPYGYPKMSHEKNIPLLIFFKKKKIPLVMYAQLQRI